MINIDFISPTNSGGNVVKSVNGKTGVVNLTAEDVHALPDTTEIPSIEGLATEEYVDAAVADVDVDLTGVATEEYVQKKIAEAQLSESDVDLSAYYTKSETDAAIEAAAPDLSGYALKTEIPSTSGLATEKYVDDAIEAIEIPDNTPIATVEVAGKVKPDGTTITISEDGTISSVATGGGGEEVTVDGTSIVKNSDGALSLANPITKKVAIGNGCSTSGDSAFSAGTYSSAKSLGSMALGGNCYANKIYSVAIGHGVESNGKAQIVLGRYNIKDSAEKYVLIVGNGKEATAETDYRTVKSNGLTVDWDGNVWVQSAVTVGADKKELATKEYVDNVAAGSVDMSSYASREYVDEAIAAIVNGDEVSY